MAKPKPEQDEKGRFISGNSGSGRPKGSRNKLGEASSMTFYQDWQANGVDVIAKARADRPHEYLKVIASILPKDVNMNVSPFEHLTDDELELLSSDCLPMSRKEKDRNQWSTRLYRFGNSPR